MLQSSNILFAMFQSSWLLGILRLAQDIGTHALVISLVLGATLLVTGSLVPLIAFKIGRRDSLYFGPYHAPLLASVFALACANAVFWTLGTVQMAMSLRLVLLGGCALAVQFALAIMRVCVYSIGSAVIIRSQDNRFLSILKHLFILLGIGTAVLLVGAMSDVLAIEQAGFVMSSVALVVGMAVYLSTFLHLPLIKLGLARNKVSGRDNLGFIYADFATSFGLRQQKKQFGGFVLSVLALALLFVGTHIFFGTYHTIFGDARDIWMLTALLVGFAIGVAVWQALLRNRQVLVSIVNVACTTIVVALLCVLFVMFALDTFHVQVGIVLAALVLLGLCSGTSFVTLNRLFVDNLSLRAPFSLKTLVYLLCFGVASVLGALLAQLASVLMLALYIGTVVVCASLAAILFAASLNTLKSDGGSN